MADLSRMPSQLLLGFFSITFGSLIAGSFYSLARARRYGELARYAIRVGGLDESGRTLLDKLDRRIENQAKRAETGTNTEARLLFPHQRIITYRAHDELSCASLPVGPRT
jgi:hypothetical protein